MFFEFLYKLFGHVPSQPATPNRNPSPATKPPRKPAHKPVNQPVTPPKPQPRATPCTNNMLLSAFKTQQRPQAERFFIFDHQGRQHLITQGNELKSGGEATTYTLPKYPTAVIKIYKPETLQDPAKTKDIEERITAMANLKHCRDFGNDFLAWPTLPFYDNRKNFVGYAMYRCHGKSFQVFAGGSRSIKRHFPRWNREQLILTAIDFVKKVQFLAKQNIMVNDFNLNNFFVDEQCKVSFIDCDSFQVPGAHGKTHISKTYFAERVAPELLKSPHLLGQPRNIHHVEFGTAMVVFNILMCGLHPYNFVNAHNGALCDSPEKNLRMGNCPLGTGSDCQLPSGNWYNLWSWLSYNIKSVFIRMFKDGHGNPNARPSLGELLAALNGLRNDLRYNPERLQLEPDHPKPRQSSQG